MSATSRVADRGPSKPRVAGSSPAGRVIRLRPHSIASGLWRRHHSQHGHSPTDRDVYPLESAGVPDSDRQRLSRSTKGSPHAVVAAASGHPRRPGARRRSTQRACKRPRDVVYSPPGGTVLQAGAGQILSVTLTPANTGNYESGSVRDQINVLPRRLTGSGYDSPETSAYRATFSVDAAGTSAAARPAPKLVGRSSLRRLS